MEIWNLLEDYEKYSSRMDDLMARIEEKIKEVPYVDKLLEIQRDRAGKRYVDLSQRSAT